MENNLLKLKFNEVSDIFHMGFVLEGYCYRGQKNITWPLKSNYERILKNKSLFATLEEAMIIDFKIRAAEFIDHLPKDEDLFQWLTIIQHYGGYTRLLDFTRSFYVALYFAFEEANEQDDPVIWALNSDYFQDHLDSELQEKRIKKNPFSNNSNIEIINFILQKSKYNELDTILKIQPMIQFNRLAVQQGTFYTIANNNKYFDEHLTRILGLKSKHYLYDAKDMITFNKSSFSESDIHELEAPPVIRFSFNKSIHPMMINYELQKMNINSSSLFPGLEGYVKSTKYTIKINDLRLS